MGITNQLLPYVCSSSPRISTICAKATVATRYCAKTVVGDPGKRLMPYAKLLVLRTSGLQHCSKWEGG